MATYAIGDLQGCYDALQRLLERLKFDPAKDKLWFCGDLVNRGGQSLETLRLIHGLREQVVLTLGNHDLSLLAIAQRRPEAQSKVNPELREVLFADDAPVLFEWMRSQKLMHHDEALGWTMSRRRPPPEKGRDERIDDTRVAGRSQTNAGPGLAPAGGPYRPQPLAADPVILPGGVFGGAGGVFQEAPARGALGFREISDGCARRRAG